MSAQPATSACPICKGTLVRRTSAYTHFCNACNYWGSTLSVNLDKKISELTTEEFDYHNYVVHLHNIRSKNFSLILNQLNLVKGDGALSILDVGCASGAFMSLAKEHGHRVTGIEPNEAMFRAASQRGLNVIHDYFPTQTALIDKFDVIIFNDVFEHIPDINLTLEHCRSHLKQDGMLILNLPNSAGFIFSIAKVLAKLRVLGPWDRLWQVMFHTPHLHYFNFDSLNKLLKQHRFDSISDKHQIPTIELDGLWSRLTPHSGVSHLIKNCAAYLCVLLMYPLLLVSEKDTFFVIYRAR